MTARLIDPAFLNEVTGLQMYTSFTYLIDLWVEKARLAEGHPFDASADIHHTVLGAAWAACFGANSSSDITRAQIKACSVLQSLELQGNIDQLVQYTKGFNPSSDESNYDSWR